MNGSVFIKAIIIFLLLGACSRGNTPETDDCSDQPDEVLKTQLQQQTFNYFWDGAEPVSGLARERLHLDGHYPHNDQDVVTTGGSGFGLMNLLVGVERGFIDRPSAVARLRQIVDYLDKADRFHGAWPHWLHGPSGKTVPFSPKDDGGDLVETAFLMQGLLTVAQYFRGGNLAEQQLTSDIDRLWQEVDWNFYTRGEQVLYWHWSPNFGWEMDFRIGGYNECLILYVLAAASPTYPIDPEVYHKGWARSGAISAGTDFYGLNTILNFYEHSDEPTGPLFWAHYSYLGLDPRGLVDRYADYWTLNRNHAYGHYLYALDNPRGYAGYGKKGWGLTSSYSMTGYAGHKPGTDDLGVIAPTAALSSFPYTPLESMHYLRYLYCEADSLVGKYGPYDAYSHTAKWNPPHYLAIDQGPIAVMVENHRSGLLWNLFMSHPDVQRGLVRLGFSSPHLSNQ